MATVTSNLPEVAMSLWRLPHIFDLTRTRGGKSLGERALDIISIARFRQSFEDRSDPKGRRWAPNAPKYLRSRLKSFRPVGTLTGQMLTLRQFIGQRHIEPNQAAVMFGQDAREIQLAEWFQEGRRRGKKRRGGQVQPPRPMFTDIGDEGEKQLDAFFLAEADRFLTDIGAD